MRQAKQTLREMLCGILIWTIIAAGILAAVSEQKGAMVGGAAFGGITAAGMMIHMYHHLDIALDLAPKQAGRHMQAAACGRLLMMAACLGLSAYFSRYIHPLGAALGLFGIKIGAFLQPAVHKIHKRCRK